MKQQSDSAPPAAESQSINLRDPYLAAFLAWLIPGAGHFYQRRWGKGGLFMVCVLGTFVVGLLMGQGRVVYASWRPTDQRYAYICQIGAGLPALPALVQSLRAKAGEAPYWGGLMAPPLLPRDRVPGAWAKSQIEAGAFNKDDFPNLTMQNPPDYVNYMIAPDGTKSLRYIAVGESHDPYNQLSDWNNKMGPFFELGTVFTLIAGLLNVLAIYDAWGGPVGSVSAPPPSPEKVKPEGA